MRRIGLAVVLALGLILAPLAVEAQQAEGLPHRVPESGLRGAGGWAEGQYERLPALAADLVRLRVDVLVTGGTAGVRAAKQATTTIPIVMTASGDAVSSGLIASLARPGGNVTGSTFFVPELMAKRLELLKEAMPRTGRVAVLVNADDPSHVPVVKAMASTARSLKIEIQKFEVRRPSEFESAFTAITKNRLDAVVVQEDALLTANAQVIE